MRASSPIDQDESYEFVPPAAAAAAAASQGDRGSPAPGAPMVILDETRPSSPSTNPVTPSARSQASVSREGSPVIAQNQESLRSQREASAAASPSPQPNSPQPQSNWNKILSGCSSMFFCCLKKNVKPERDIEHESELREIRAETVAAP